MFIDTKSSTLIFEIARHFQPLKLFHRKFVGALQLNLQYAETRSLPVLMPETPGPAVVSQSSPIKISQGKV